MFKKISVFALSLVMVFTFFLLQRKPVFINYGQSFEIYLNGDGSLSQGVVVSIKDYILYGNITGESCVVSESGFSVNDFFADFNAKVLFTETVDEGVSYYGYSSKIKYVQNINGKRVNLHVFVGKDQIKVGSPIIYGSF